MPLAPITYTDSSGTSHTLEGSIHADDFHLDEVGSFKSEFAFIRTLFAETVFTEQLNATVANIETLVAKKLTTTSLKSEISRLDLVNVNAIASASSGAYASLDSYYGNHFYFNMSGGGGSVTHRDIKEGIYDIILEGPTNNVYTLTKKLYNNTETEIGTFSRAVSSWTDTWDADGNVTVKASPQNQTHKITISTRAEGTIQYDNFDVAYGTYDTNGNFIKRGQKNIYLTLDSTGSSATVSAREDSSEGNAYAQIDVSDVWTAGYNSNLPSGISIGSLTDAGTTTPSDATNASAFSTSSIWSTFANDYGYIKFPVTVHGKTKNFYFSFDNRKTTSNGNPAYGEGYGAAKMSGSWSGANLSISKNTTGSASLSYTEGASASISYNSTTHKYTATAKASCGGADRASATSIGGTEAYDAGYTAGAASVTPGTDISGGFYLGGVQFATYQPSHIPSYMVQNSLQNVIKNNTNGYVWFYVEVRNSSGTSAARQWFRCSV